jgi:molybdenum cofactor cytidylyltransferase
MRAIGTASAGRATLIFVLILAPFGLEYSGSMRRKSAALACIVLAAGASARLGRPKQLVRRQGRPLLARAIGIARRAAPGAVVVVLGACRQRLKSLTRRESARIATVYNADWAEGLASSLRLGLKALPADTRAALILLPDQAKVSRYEIDRLVRRWRARPERAAAARYAGRTGAPAIIPRRLFRAAKTLEGDVGARHLLRAGGFVTQVPIASAAFDLDTPEDLARL